MSAESLLAVSARSSWPVWLVASAFERRSPGRRLLWAFNVLQAIRDIAHVPPELARPLIDAAQQASDERCYEIMALRAFDQLHARLSGVFLRQSTREGPRKGDQSKELETWESP